MNFNSIKVRLELDGPFAHELDGVNFNSIKVRLEHGVMEVIDFKYGNFNSIKVRLELYRQVRRCSSRQFQFHKGAIRTYCIVVLVDIIIYFNSIKVRLERLLRPRHFKYSLISIP